MAALPALTAIGSLAGGAGQLTSAMRNQQQVPVITPKESSPPFPQTPPLTQQLGQFSPQTSSPSLSAPQSSIEQPNLLALLGSLGGSR